MPVTPHPISITVYDKDNSTLLAGAIVYVRNATKRTTSSTTTTDANGVAEIDLANLPVASGLSAQYEVGDEILIIAYNGNYHDAASYTVAGASNTETLYMNPVRHNPDLNAETVKTIILGNTSATVSYAKVFNFPDARLLAHIECPANDSKIAYVDCLQCHGGIVIERENQALIVTAIIK